MFFFSSRRRHTRLQGDWSSDVCSSDLPPLHLDRRAPRPVHPRAPLDLALLVGDLALQVLLRNAEVSDQPPVQHQIGRAAGRGRGEISVVAGSFKKKKKEVPITQASAII